jgi:hypothetical protein
MLGTLLTWANRKRGALTRLVVRQLQAATTVPYCHVYATPAGFVTPAGFKTSASWGLLAWHVVQAPSGPSIISYWQDEPHYQYSRGQFEKALGITMAPAWGGATGDLHATKPPWWPSSLKEALFAAAAIVGAITVILNASELIFEPLWTTPKAEVSFAVTKLDLSEGDSTKVSVSARNATEFVPVQLIASAKLLGDGRDVLTVELSPSYYQTVAPDASENLTATVEAPHLGRHSVPVDYNLSVSPTVRTWRFGHASACQSAELPVKVWPRSFGFTGQLKRTQSDPKVYSAMGTLYSEQMFLPGLHGIITIEAPGSTNLSLSIQPPFRGSEPLSSSVVHAFKTIRMDFASPPLEKYHAYPFVVTITSTRPLQEGWDGIEKSIKLRFIEIMGG